MKLDLKERETISSTEAAKFLGITVSEIHRLVKTQRLSPVKSAGGKKFLFLVKDILDFGKKVELCNETDVNLDRDNLIQFKDSFQRIIVGSSSNMVELTEGCVNLIVTSPPYFNAKSYSSNPKNEDLGSIHDIREWLDRIGLVWKECYRVLQSGRKMFINIMNLPVETKDGGFRTLNLVGKTIDLCESIGFVFKGDIVWKKTNGSRANFGSYPYPGNILINNMHEFILHFEKPCKNSGSKYSHVSKDQKEKSKLDKDFWLSLKKTDVWEISPVPSGDGRIHVAPFPKELPTRLIRAFSYVGETVLDPFVGSGTTCVAAAECGRNGIGYELYQEIASICINRLKVLVEENG